VVAQGKGITPGAIRGEVRMIDLAPTFAAMQGVTLDDVDGAPVPALTGNGEAPA
jgi:hypothetical protein